MGQGGSSGKGDNKKGYVAQSVEAWAKLATKRPAFFVVRTLILGGGIYFFGFVAWALAQRAF
jgi:hypothetical protein